MKKIIRSGIEYFEEIRRFIETYLELKNEFEIDIMAAYAIGTYFYSQLPAYPYIYFDGMPGSGKTKAGQVMECVCNNAYITSGMTDRSMVRMIDDAHHVNSPDKDSDLRPDRGPLTLVYDEVDLSRQSGSGEQRRLVLSGYKKGIPFVILEEITVEKRKTYQPRTFETYCPKIFCAFRYPDPEIRSRCIVIRMVPGMNPDITHTTPLGRKGEMQKFRGSVKTFCESKSHEILSLWNELKMPRHFLGRTVELWKPLLIAAKLVDQETYDKMLIIAGDYQAEELARMRDHPHCLVVEALTEAVKASGWYSNKDLMLDVSEKDDNITSEKLGYIMRDLGFPARRSSEGVQYSVTMEKLSGLVLYYGIELKDVRKA